ncbi:addiction module protein [Prosthecobacter sp.]|uniref:addiction module protein n=1 Tax=Prosthecobacter sp. TaxID=1965333 RepID=UPI003784B190
MSITYEAIMDAALQLPPADRCRVAAGLWDSVGSPTDDLAPDELETLLNQREAEMDQDPSQEISHQEFLAHFSARR